MSDISNRLADGFSRELDLLCAKLVDETSKTVESPIEALLGAAIWIGLCTALMQCPEASTMNFNPVWCGKDDRDHIAKATFAIVPQFNWGRYRIDFAIFRSGELALFVECDGHNFHERTPDQALRDRTKDREIQAAGLKILRFTGREIHRNAIGCAAEVMEFLFPKKGL